MVDQYLGYRRLSKGWQSDPIARLHPCILFGPGKALTREFVQKKNITHVVNCAFDENSPEWFRKEFPDNYHCLNAVDNEKVNILQWYTEFESIMDKYLRATDSKVVYVHCQCGMNRSGFLLLTYMCNRFKYSVEGMIKEILIQRPCALANPVFMKQVIQYFKKT